MMTNTQLELGLPAKNSRLRRQRRRTRTARARWWFAQMREAVDKAVDCPAESAWQAEQIWFSGARRRIKP